MTVENAKVQVNSQIESVEKFVESLKTNENPYAPRFGTIIQYLEGTILPALKGIKSELDAE